MLKIYFYQIVALKINIKVCIIDTYAMLYNDDIKMYTDYV